MSRDPTWKFHCPPTPYSCPVVHVVIEWPLISKCLCGIKKCNCTYILKDAAQKFVQIWPLLQNDITGSALAQFPTWKFNFGPYGHLRIFFYDKYWYILVNTYRHSSIYAVNVGTQNKNRGSKNCVNRGYLVVLKGRKIG